MRIKTKPSAQEIRVALSKRDDRCLSLYVTTASGRQYKVGLEFLDQMGSDDEVQVSVKKTRTPRDHEERRISTANALIAGDTRIFMRGRDEGILFSSVWFEFHAVDGLPAIGEGLP